MRKRYRKTNKYEKIIGISLISIVLFLTIGFSAYQASAEIENIGAVIRVQKDIRITGISLAGSSSNAVSSWEDYTANKISSGLNLPNSNSTITYNVEITNLGNVEAAISNITGLPSNLTYTFGNYNLNDVLCDDTDPTLCKLGSRTTIPITIGYAENGYDSSNTNYSINMDFEFSYAVDSVALMNNTLYNTLQAAIDDVPTDNTETTIKLLNNTSEVITVDRYKNIILDLNGKVVSNDGNNPVFSNNGTVDLRNGTITTNAATNGAFNNEQYGKFTMSSGSIVVTGTGNRQALYNNKGTVTISGSAYLSSRSTARAAVQNLSGGTMTITGGTIVSTGLNALNNQGTLTVGVKDGDVNKNSPIFQGEAAGIYSTVTYGFYNGTAKGKTLALDTASRVNDVETGYNVVYSEETINGVLYKVAYLAVGKKVSFNANGGSVSEGSRYIETGERVGTLPVPTRTGHTFDGWFTKSSGGTQVNSNTTITANITFYAHWTKISDTAQIGNTKYASLTEAINAVPNNTQTTIELLDNTSEALTVSSSKNIIIDLAGYTISNNGSLPVFENAGTLKLTNGTISSTATQGAINNTAGSLTIEDMNITATQRQTVYITGGTVTIKGNSNLSSSTSGTPAGGTMERGTIQVVTGTLYVLDGTITATNQQAISNQDTVIIGEKDGSINASSPVLMGQVYGIRSTGTVKFYDGVIKGQTSVIRGTITEIETNAQLVAGTETISGNTYQTVHLEF